MRICSVMTRSRSTHSAMAGSMSGPDGLGILPVAMPNIFVCLSIVTTQVFQASQLSWVSSTLNLSCLVKGVMAIGARNDGLEVVGPATDNGTIVEVRRDNDGGKIAVELVPDWEGGCADSSCGAVCVAGVPVSGAPVVVGG